MAAMNTALKLFADSEKKRTSTYAGHSASDPHLVIESRRVPVGNQTVISQTIKVVSGIEDSDGVVLSSKVSLEANVNYPLNGIASDVTAALTIFRDLIAGDEFAAAILSQNWLAEEVV